jgi:hypothetical protein
LDAYSIALYVHLLSLLLATVSATLTTYAAVQLRSSLTRPDGLRWAGMIARAVPGFPLATLGLFASGAYMTATEWTWLTSWIDASIVGLALIVVLGSVVEGRRGRALMTELQRSGISARARALARDPAAWTARMTTLALVLAVIFEMTFKPPAVVAALALVVGVAAGVLAAVPLWKGGRERAFGTAASMHEEEAR